MYQKEIIKPIIGQKVFIYFKLLHHYNNKELNNGKITEIADTPLAIRDGVSFTFSIITEPMYSSGCDILSESTRKRHLHSSSYHLEPNITKNINWTNRGMFGEAFIFYSKHSFNKWKYDVKEQTRKNHLKQAEYHLKQA